MSLSAQTQARPYFDRRIQCDAVFVLPGHHFVQAEGNGAITTLLGSCIAACIRDTSSAIGGLNHFLLPGDTDCEQASSARYGVHAMELLINDILKRGVQKNDLEAKIFGGAAVIESSQSDPVGQRNARFVRDFLSAEGIPIAAAHLGGDRARRIYFFPSTGRVSVLSVAPTDAQDVTNREARLREEARKKTQTGGVELF